MSHGRNDPPSNWIRHGVITVDQAVGIYAVPMTRNGQPSLTVWHWCQGEERWIGAGVDDHTIVSTDPLHIEPSLLTDWCCGLHGWIRDGKWVQA